MKTNNLKNYQRKTINAPVCRALFACLFSIGLLAAGCVSEAAAQKQTDLTVKEASVVKQPITSRVHEIKVVVANSDKTKAENVSVIVYSMPAIVWELNNITFYANIENSVQSGKLTDSNFNDYFSGNKVFYSLLNLKDKATVESHFDEKNNPSWLAWAQSSQQISLEPNAAQTLNFKMPTYYEPPITGKAEQDKLHKVVKLHFYQQFMGQGNPYQLVYFVASTKNLTFQQSVFYVVVKGGVDKNEKDNTYFIAQQLF